jgi:hypothetical protein
LSISESSWIGKLEGTKVFPLFCMQTEQSVHNKQDSHEHHQRLLMPISGLPKNWYHMHILCQGMSHYYHHIISAAGSPTLHFPCHMEDLLLW